LGGTTEHRDADNRKPAKPLIHALPQNPCPKKKASGVY
jgi:hypothetical protein